MSEFREKIFPVKMIVIEIVRKKQPRNVVFIDGEKVLSVFFYQTDFHTIVYPELITQLLIDMPDELIVFDWRDNANKVRIYKKSFRQLVVVNFELHEN